MSLLWIIRIGFLIILMCLVTFWSYLLQNRNKYVKIIESKSWNIFFVILYDFSCFITTGFLPSDARMLPKLEIFNDTIIIYGFQIIGCVELTLNLLLAFLTLKMRKVIGIQDTKSGLITSGPYRFFRHPIYTAIFGISISLALIFLNWDGMLVLPAILIANILQAKSEERFDLIKRYNGDFLKYKKSTRLFG